VNIATAKHKLVDPITGIRSLTGRYVLRSDWLRHAERVTADAQLHGTEASIQETYYPTLTCFGCGHANERGLRLRSYEVDGVVRAAFMPWPEHDSGGGFLNGGIVSTLLDCHGAAAVLLEAHRRGWEPAPGALLPFVTAGLDVRFLRPSPLREPVELVAELLSVSEPEITVVSRLWWEGKERATGTAVWKRWRQR
jgi:acyl-coenzyme A thioesterase PaaI-like protein